MFRYLGPIILIGIAVTGFLTYTDNLYKDFSNLKTEVASYNEALGNANDLKAERDKLVQKNSSFELNDLTRLQKLLPDSVDNIRLILEIEKLAAPYGMVLKDVKYESENQSGTTQSPAVTVPTSSLSKLDKKDYGTWTLGFTTQGTYPNFISFLKDMENNLRIVDISSIKFSSDVSPVGKSQSAGIYKYDFQIKTYWLKN